MVELSGWQREFDEPIELPDRRRFITLHDAATFIAGLPLQVQDAPEWRSAIEALILVAGQGGSTTIARVAVARALSQRGVGSK